MGGKNPMVVDSDADLDEAIPAITQSAFGYQGQKCSALSRLILLESNYEVVLKRLIDATSSLRMGHPEDPGAALGPVINEEAFRKITEYIELGKKEAPLLFQGKVPEHLNGYFIAPAIFGPVNPQARIAKEEVFGPVLAVFKVESFQKAIELANDSDYALTAGVFSRSPAHLEYARNELRAGNIYINRGITGAMVGRQPFGGFKMSGGGTKAGGTHYLEHFFETRVVTENTMRRGFAPASRNHSGE
jgi:RHH-type proline utilization regulon transcriptional repressor/proline dehydrogenase/delta 1-pyrroline-5-carboxylate dehydrogenase